MICNYDKILNNFYHRRFFAFETQIFILYLFSALKIGFFYLNSYNQLALINKALNTRARKILKKNRLRKISSLKNQEIYLKKNLNICYTANYVCIGLCQNFCLFFRCLFFFRNTIFKITFTEKLITSIGFKTNFEYFQIILKYIVLIQTMFKKYTHLIIIFILRINNVFFLFLDRFRKKDTSFLNLILDKKNFLIRIFGIFYYKNKFSKFILKSFKNLYTIYQIFETFFQYFQFIRNPLTTIEMNLKNNKYLHNNFKDISCMYFFVFQKKMIALAFCLWQKISYYVYKNEYTGIDISEKCFFDCIFFNNKRNLSNPFFIGRYFDLNYKMFSRAGFVNLSLFFPNRILNIYNLNTCTTRHSLNTFTVNLRVTQIDDILISFTQFLNFRLEYLRYNIINCKANRECFVLKCLDTHSEMFSFSFHKICEYHNKKMYFFKFFSHKTIGIDLFFQKINTQLVQIITIFHTIILKFEKNNINFSFFYLYSRKLDRCFDFLKKINFKIISILFQKKIKFFKYLKYKNRFLKSLIKFYIKKIYFSHIQKYLKKNTSGFLLVFFIKIALNVIKNHFQVNLDVVRFLFYFILFYKNNNKNFYFLFKFCFSVDFCLFFIRYTNLSVLIIFFNYNSIEKKITVKTKKGISKELKARAFCLFFISELKLVLKTRFKNWFFFVKFSGNFFNYFFKLNYVQYKLAFMKIAMFTKIYRYNEAGGVMLIDFLCKFLFELYFEKKFFENIIVLHNFKLHKNTIHHICFDKKGAKFGKKFYNKNTGLFRFGKDSTYFYLNSKKLKNISSV